MEPRSKSTAAVRLRSAIVVGVVLVIGAAVFLFLQQRQTSPAAVQAGPSMHLASSNFAADARIPARFTCDGENLSPNLDWTGAPSTTKTYALILHDPDAPIDFTHWLVWDIPPDVHQLAEGASNRAAMPEGSNQGMNGFGRVGYGGPCPPRGKAHHYTFRIFALDTKVGLGSGASREQLESAMRSHIVSQGQIVALYQRGE